MEKTWRAPHVGPHPVIIIIAAVKTVETRTVTIEGANIQNVVTTMTDPNSSRLDSPHPAATKKEATDGLQTDGTIEMIDVAVEIASKEAIKGESGAKTPTPGQIVHSKRKWMTIADSTCTRGRTENFAPITR